jgi:glycosyltransferase involved in cell wall biosynthesis
MACGTPVVALDDGAIKEVLNNHALIAKDEDEMVIIVQTITQTKPIELREFVNSNYSREVSAARYEKLYRRILSGNEW